MFALNLGESKYIFILKTIISFFIWCIRICYTALKFVKLRTFQTLNLAFFSLIFALLSNFYFFKSIYNFSITPLYSSYQIKEINYFSEE